MDKKGKTPFITFLPFLKTPNSPVTADSYFLDMNAIPFQLDSNFIVTTCDS